MSYDAEFPVLNSAGLMCLTGGAHIFSHIGWGGTANPQYELIRFDFSSLASPEDVLIASASIWIKLIANTYPYNALQVGAYVSSRAWVAAQATRDIYSTGNSWQSICSTGANDYNHTQLGALDMVASEATGWKEINMDSQIALIDGLIKGTVTNNGFFLRPAEDYSGGFQNAKEFDYAGDKPYLKIAYDYIGAEQQPIFWS
jgi:hypothetical protein